MIETQEIMIVDPVTFAIQMFFESGYSYGSIIPTEWFHAAFRLKAPTSIAEADQVRMLYMQYMGIFRSNMLIFHRMALRSKSGVGQEVVKPSEQTRWAMEDARNQITRVLKKTNDRLTYLNADRLSDADRRENLDAINRLSFLARSTRTSFRLGN